MRFFSLLMEARSCVKINRTVRSLRHQEAQSMYDGFDEDIIPEANLIFDLMGNSAERVHFHAPCVFELKQFVYLARPRCFVYLEVTSIQSYDLGRKWVPARSSFNAFMRSFASRAELRVASINTELINNTKVRARAISCRVGLLLEEI